MPTRNMRPRLLRQWWRCGPIRNTSDVKAFEELRRTGLARAVGTGLNVTETTGRLVEALELDVVLLAGRYTLLEQGPLEALFPLCLRKGTAVLAAGAFNSGLLAGGSTYNYKAVPQDLVAKAKRIEAVCSNHGVALKDAALRFPLLHPVVAGVVFGAVTAAEVRENIASLSTSIPDALWCDLKTAGLLDGSAPT